MEFTYFGHACFSVKIGENILLFDPFITPNPLASNININGINPNYILISHGHEDHLADAETIAKQSNATIISNFEIVTWFQKKGIEHTHPMNHGGKWNFPFGSVKMVNAIHSSTLPDGSNGGNPAGFVIETNEKTFYFAGDSALTYDMKLIGEQYNIDFAVLPIGDNFTMDINDAVKCADFVNCSHIIGIHFDTFPYIEINHESVKKIAESGNKKLTLLKIGESIKL